MKNLIDKILKIKTVSDALSSSDKAITIARQEAYVIIKNLFIRYFIVMNLVFGVIGFVLGFIIGKI